MKILADPLYAETVPDGTFGGPRPVRDERPDSPAQAAVRRAALEAELRRLARRKRENRCAAA